MPADPRPAHGAYALVVVSPHLDDAVFSCAGAITQARAAGPVLVVNVFTRFTDRAFGRMREAEERLAAARTGFESISLCELDAGCRPGCGSLARVFGPPSPGDLAWVPALAARLSAVLAGISYGRLLLPLAAGWHVDHLLVHLATREWGADPRTAWYEDTPYVWYDQMLRLRLDELGRHPGDDGDRGLAALAPDEAGRRMAADVVASALVRRMRPAPWRWIAGLATARFVRGLAARHPRPPAGGPPAMRWSPTLVALEAPLAKIGAMALYRSQFDTFFIDADDCIRRMRAHAAAAGSSAKAVERQWTGTPGACA